MSFYRGAELIPFRVDFAVRMCVCGLRSCRYLSEQIRGMGDARGSILTTVKEFKKTKSSLQEVKSRKEKLVRLHLGDLSLKQKSQAIIVFSRKQVLQPRELYQSTNQPT